MPKTYTLMTALPPTKGHMAMINFAASLGNETVVLIHVQDGEPYRTARHFALASAVSGIHSPKVSVRSIRTSESDDPTRPGFKEFWRDKMKVAGFRPGDTLVTSETYGIWLAEMLGGKFMPFDVERQLVPIKATDIRGRDGLIRHFDQIIPEFQQVLRSTVTVFGSESIGKTTFSRELAALSKSHWLFEYARPYLETVGTDITRDSMKDIYRGQHASQLLAKTWQDKPFIIQDTDLFSTIGYWRLPHWRERLGPVPPDLTAAARRSKSDKYIILRSNIDFEADPLRYGGDVRESTDQYWIDLAEEFQLNYEVIEYSDANLRLGKGLLILKNMLADKQTSIEYDRKGR